MLAFNEISQVVPRIQAGSSTNEKAKRKIVSQQPNHVSVALSIKAGASSILLGSDLEEDATGSLAPADTFKVPHHGSKTAYVPAIWSQMVKPEPWALLTPFIRGKHFIPSKDEARSILNHTQNAYITAPVASKRPRFSNKTVERTVAEVTKDIREIPQSTGHIRMRLKNPTSVANQWSIQLLGNARHLNAAHL
jgi:hypothetical protein